MRKLVALVAVVGLLAGACADSPVIGTVVGKEHDERHESYVLVPYTFPCGKSTCTAYRYIWDVDDEDWILVIRSDADEREHRREVSRERWDATDIGAHVCIGKECPQ